MVKRKAIIYKHIKGGKKKFFKALRKVPKSGIAIRVGNYIPRTTTNLSTRVKKPTK